MADTCTHLKELLVPMATTAYQSFSAVQKQRGERVDANGRPLKVDSCYAYSAQREVVARYWPAFHRPPRPEEPK